MSGQLDHKVALVTGAASGLGRAVVKRFLAEGARVVGFDRVEATVDEPAPADTFAAVVGDVRSADDNRRAVALAIERFGRLDVLVANAGIYDNRQPMRALSASQLDAAFDELFGINVKGYLHAVSAATPALTAARGCIIFTSSLSGSRAGFGGPLYVAAKHAVDGLTRQLALELAPDIRVNAVAPGYVPTGLRGIASLGQAENPSAPTAEQLTLRAFAMPDDYAGAYVFLASDACSRTATGTVLALDGGAALRGPRA